jgi:hypothetical protein
VGAPFQSRLTLAKLNVSVIGAVQQHARPRVVHQGRGLVITGEVQVASVETRDYLRR